MFKNSPAVYIFLTGIVFDKVNYFIALLSPPRRIILQKENVVSADQITWCMKRDALSAKIAALRNADSALQPRKGII